MTVALVIEPPIEDSSGYRLTGRDLQFLALGGNDVMRWRQRQSPLGMTVEHFLEMRASLLQALARDGVTDADVRLKGSSADFFSGTHKRMPADRAEVSDLFVQLRQRLPTPAELQHILTTLDDHWPPRARRPSQRPFDCMYRLGVDRYPSDYDIQLSSDQIARRVAALFEPLGLEPSQIRVMSPKYSFFQHLVADACPALRAWELHRSDVLRREVTIAVFPSCGPPEGETSNGQPSSHFRDSDWILLGVGA